MVLVNQRLQHTERVEQQHIQLLLTQVEIQVERRHLIHLEQRHITQLKVLIEVLVKLLEQAEEQVKTQVEEQVTQQQDQHLDQHLHPQVYMRICRQERHHLTQHV